MISLKTCFRNFILPFCLIVAGVLTAADRPNIVWITCEDMSPTIGCYGDEFANTPNLDAFAKKAIRYTNAWSTMPICAPARSTLITGCYSTALGTMNLRGIVPQSSRVIPMPKILREYGYYTTNDHKTDYNFSHEGIWSESKPGAHWRNRPDPDQPFFHVVNYQDTHEGPTNSFRDPRNGYTKRHSSEMAPVPLWFPNTAEMRRIMAHHYDLISAMDTFFGKVLAELKEDGLEEDTIVFFFSDHGAGLPRHKRYLYETGLKVPMMVHIPDKYRQLATSRMGSVSDRLVGFVDLPATVLELTGIQKAAFHQGNAFLGKTGKAKPKGERYMFGARDRADDVQDLSRTVRNDRYRYTRNYMPYLPYHRVAAIFAGNEGADGVVSKEMKKPNPKPETMSLFAPKPFEELYDLENDPNELNNLAADPQFAAIKNELSGELEKWILRIRDAAFLPEGEMMRRGAHDSVYDMAQDPLRYDLESILAAADASSHPDTTIEELTQLAKSADSGVRYWAACGLLALEEKCECAVELLKQLYADDNPCVEIVAAEALAKLDPTCPEAAKRLAQITSTYVDTEPAIAMQSARALVELGAGAEPVLDEVAAVLERIEGPVWDYYRNWYYHMFMGMSLHQVQMNNGIIVERYQSGSKD
ncbi:MAG: sulfatase-like hydrolase/transferase [Puniceicoccaceae bacterium]